MVKHNTDFSYGTTITEVKYASEVIFTKDTPYLTLTDELWGVFCEDLGESWPRYNSTALYLKPQWQLFAHANGMGYHGSIM